MSKRRETLKIMCLKWEPDDETFSDIIELAGRVLDKDRQELADEWDVPVRTIERWENNTSEPTSAVSTYVVDCILEQLRKDEDMK